MRYIPPVTTSMSLGTNESLMLPSEFGMLIKVGYEIIRTKIPRNNNARINFHGLLSAALRTLYRYAFNIRPP